ncbi:hypothetical protein ACH41E_18140 [Streptomyces sp. NPDC020412]|uniref:hypothetical protein n=1 Tax=Streptomyces sp. NPDC020412 TaxID=3365073 RepID=UPI00379C88DE
MGTWLRTWGGTGVTLHRDDQPDETVSTEAGARVLDDYLRATLGRCSIATVPLCQVYDRLLILTSDGAHSQTTHDTLTALVRQHTDTPQAPATAFVAAAQDGHEDGEPYLDDATCIVLSITA